MSLGKNQENNTTLQFCEPVSTGNKWHSHQVSGACCFVAARGSWGFCHAPWLGMHLNPASLTWLDWESPAPGPCWQCWQQCHLQQAPSAGLFLSSGQVLHRSNFHLTTALAATLVYSTAIWAPLLLTSNAPRLFYLLLGLMFGHHRWLVA